MSERFIIRGGRPLRGTVEVRGSKNAAPKLMIASLLTDEECVIDHVPFSVEIDITKELCERVGGTVAVKDHTCTMRMKTITTSLVSDLSRKNRIPILALGPLLHRTGVAEVPVLGGCPIGHRPINFHVEALTKMGVTVERREHTYFAKAKKIHGADISFPYPSVGATENVILAAVLAEGTTRVRNAAVEPEIGNLIQMLQAMGARISFAPERREIHITGVSRLRGAHISTMPDRSEIVSFAAAALATDGDIFIPNIDETYLGAFLEALDLMGAHHDVEKGGIRFYGTRPYAPAIITTSPHPGFMTDWQQPFSVLLTQAEGASIIHETVYEDRLGYTQDLKRMGADIEISTQCPYEEKCRYAGMAYHHTARIIGPRRLLGSEMSMTDVRAGMAHIVAALTAGGESVISGIEHVDRGYERIDERLRELGADIRRV